MKRLRPVPILLYHNIASVPPGALVPSLYVSPERFASQMRWLRRVGYRGVSISQAMPYLRGERSGRVVVITLDDGYADNLEHALPALLRNGFGATCYVTSAEVGGHNAWDAERLRVKKPLMSRAQLREWVAAGMEVGAHSRTHPHLTELSSGALHDEVHGCKAELEDMVGREVRHFCYPYGSRDDAVVAEVRRAGFETAACIRRGRARPSDDPYLLPRVEVGERDTALRFLITLLTPYEEYRARKRARRAERTSPR
jgi:peptidoglycan/xylan/chitin deacetylase (PgdA/CDA1 family)